jgi:hypothetical protein
MPPVGSRRQAATPCGLGWTAAPSRALAGPTANAGGAHLGEGDLLAGEGVHVPIKPQAAPASNLRARPIREKRLRARSRWSLRDFSKWRLMYRRPRQSDAKTSVGRHRKAQYLPGLNHDFDTS